MKKWIYRTLPIIILVVILLLKPFYDADMYVCDSLYRQLNGTHRDIKLIVIDEEALNEYGNFNVWGRERIAELIEMLSENPDTAPAVIGLDFMFTGYYDEATDARLAEACKKAGNVVEASNLVYKGVMKKDDKGAYYYDAYNIDSEELPYPELAEQVTPGFSNTNISHDGYIRYTRIQAMLDDTLRESLAFSVYRKYQEARGEEVVIPKTDSLGKLRFFYSGIPGEYPNFSLKNVLNGDIPVTEFDDCIVYVGAYAAGFQDAYATSVERGQVMYGVEINANITQAMIEGKTALGVSSKIYALIICVVVFIYLLIAEKQKLPVAIIEAVLLIGVHMVVGRVLAANGLIIPQIYFIIIMVMLCVYYIIEKYFVERLKRKNMLTTFKKYVAPQVVEELSKSGKFELHLGGEKRDVAVLFVDIRGFTPMSESLSPEQIVQILNEYLALTTSCIFKHNGTLDKFIGDATMAVFNAPFDLEDYIYRAVCTAWDIRAGSEELAARLMEKFGKTISFGIGVNCGEAVVGNIGCDFRMDYTAIGDTVNTAARLESNAKPGEILISEEVFEAVGDRIEVEEVGQLSLKGKKNAVNVYRMVGLKEEQKVVTETEEE